MGAEALAFATLVTAVASGGVQTREARQTRKESEKLGREERVGIQVASQKEKRVKEQAALRRIKRRGVAGAEATRRPDILSQGATGSTGGGKTLLGQ